MTRLHGWFLTGAVALAPVCARADLPRPQPPQPPSPPAACTLTVVHALAAEGGIDPALARLRKYLESPAFKAWKTFKLLSEKEETVREGQTAKYSVPNGAVSVTYSGHKVNGDKHTVQASINIETTKLKTKTTYTAGEDKPFLAAGESHNNGILIYALSCKTNE